MLTGIASEIDRSTPQRSEGEEEAAKKGDCEETGRHNDQQGENDNGNEDGNGNDDRVEREDVRWERLALTTKAESTRLAGPSSCSPWTHIPSSTSTSTSHSHASTTSSSNPAAAPGNVQWRPAHDHHSETARMRKTSLTFTSSLYRSVDATYSSTIDRAAMYWYRHPDYRPNRLAPNCTEQSPNRFNRGQERGDIDRPAWEDSAVHPTPWRSASTPSLTETEAETEMMPLLPLPSIRTQAVLPRTLLETHAHGLPIGDAVALLPPSAPQHIRIHGIKQGPHSNSGSSSSSRSSSNAGSSFASEPEVDSPHTSLILLSSDPTPSSSHKLVDAHNPFDAAFARQTQSRTHTRVGLQPRPLTVLSHLARPLATPLDLPPGTALWDALVPLLLPGPAASVLVSANATALGPGTVPVAGSVRFPGLSRPDAARSSSGLQSRFPTSAYTSTSTSASTSIPASASASTSRSTSVGSASGASGSRPGWPPSRSSSSSSSMSVSSSGHTRTHRTWRPHATPLDLPPGAVLWHSPPLPGHPLSDEGGAEGSLDVNGTFNGGSAYVWQRAVELKVFTLNPPPLGTFSTSPASPSFASSSPSASTSFKSTSASASASASPLSLTSMLEPVPDADGHARPKERDSGMEETGDGKTPISGLGLFGAAVAHSAGSKEARGGYQDRLWRNRRPNANPKGKEMEQLGRLGGSGVGVGSGRGGPSRVEQKFWTGRRPAGPLMRTPPRSYPHPHTHAHQRLHPLLHAAGLDSPSTSTSTRDSTPTPRASNAGFSFFPPPSPHTPRMDESPDLDRHPKTGRLKDPALDLELPVPVLLTPPRTASPLSDLSPRLLVTDGPAPALLPISTSAPTTIPIYAGSAPLPVPLRRFSPRPPPMHLYPVLPEPRYEGRYIVFSPRDGPSPSSSSPGASGLREVPSGGTSPVNGYADGEAGERAREDADAGAPAAGTAFSFTFTRRRPPDTAGTDPSLLGPKEGLDKPPLLSHHPSSVDIFG